VSRSGLRKFKKNSFFISANLILIFVLAFHHPHVHAQQTIINVPSSEVLPAGEMVLKQSSGFSPFYPGACTSLTPSATVGVGKSFELSTAVEQQSKTELKL